MLRELFQLRPLISLTILLSYRFPFQHLKTWVAELDLLGETQDLNSQENQETFRMFSGTAEEIFELVSGSGEDVLTRNKKLRRVTQNIHLTKIKMKSPPQKSSETKRSMLHYLIDQRSDFTLGKIVQILTQLLLITKTGKSNLMVSARYRRKVPPGHHDWSSEKLFICHGDALFQLIRQS